MPRLTKVCSCNSQVNSGSVWSNPISPKATTFGSFNCSSNLLMIEGKLSRDRTFLGCKPTAAVNPGL